MLERNSILGRQAILVVVIAGVLSAATTAVAIPPPWEEPLYLEPIPGLTTGRHVAPPRVAIPIGSIIHVTKVIPGRFEVEWNGAYEIARTDTFSKSECPFNVIGLQTVVATAINRDGTVVWEQALQFDVIDIEAFNVSNISVSAAPLRLTEDSTNTETMGKWFGRSIAQVRQIVGTLRRRLSIDGGMVGTRYITSVNREVTLSVAVEPFSMGALTEWRVGGQAVALGRRVTYLLTDLGTQQITVGPPKRSLSTKIETYRVDITSHVSNEDIIHDGDWVTFEAVTDPPGYEQYITWISSTKYGWATPVVGEGSSFTVRFDDTFDFDPEMGNFQWLGVKADNAIFGQDQKPGACCSSAGTCTDGLPELECTENGGQFIGEETTCAAETCTKKTISVQYLNLTGPAGSGVMSGRNTAAGAPAATHACIVDCLTAVIGPETNVNFTAMGVTNVAVPADLDGDGMDDIDANGSLSGDEIKAIRKWLYDNGHVPAKKIVVAPIGDFAGGSGATVGLCGNDASGVCNVTKRMDNLSFVDDEGDCRTFAHEVAHSFCLCHCTPAQKIMTHPRATALTPAEIPLPPAPCPDGGTASNEVAFSAAHRAEVRRKACDPQLLQKADANGLARADMVLMISKSD